ncbi:hypothetical protein PBPRA2702 [Photobacterium profundum SS9]|uniref:Uncharacterized protein n=1 Tax=Photobacterium profundum (strain SS9) TaxID=298386 RepID=Q6LNP6_PHOPR|nr:hypothetical protein PBPRA2702 [Photobacterium profundum SS9]
MLYASTGVLDANLICVEAYLKTYYPEFDVITIKGKQKLSARRRLNTLMSFFSAYYLIVDHAIPRFLTNKKRKIYNVWHGIPLKTIRHFDNKRFKETFLDFESKNLNGLVCSSMLDMAVMSACFQVPPSRCILSGLPRNDLVFKGQLEWYEDVQEARLIENLQGRKLVSWMPTYRGTWYENNEIVGFSESDECQLFDFLKANNAVLGVRPHKFSCLQPFPLLEAEGLLLDLKEYDVTNTVLKHTDILITDYSSVWLDYSIISSNICLYLYDAQKYDGERGMIYPLDTVFPGDISYDFNQLLMALNQSMESMGNNLSKGSDLFFKYRDNNNTKRFIEAILDE